MAEELENARIDQLPANGVLKGSYPFPIFNTDTQKTERVDLSEILSSNTSQNFEWVTDNDPGYALNEVVTYGGKWWQSLVNNNLNVLPGTDPTKWLEVAKSPSGFVFWQPGIYPQDEVFVLYPSTGDIQIYHLIDPTRPYASADFAAELAAGDWEVISAGVDHYKGLYATSAALTAAHPTASPGDYAFVDAGTGQDVQFWIWDNSDNVWKQGGSSPVPIASPTVAGIAKLYDTDGTAIDGSMTQRAISDLTGAGGGVGFYGSSYWNYNSAAIVPPPASGRIRFNSVTMASITQMFIHETSATGQDVSNFFKQLIDGDTFYIQQKSDATRWLRAVVNGTPVDNGVYWTMNLTLITTGGIMFVNNQDLVVRLTIGGSVFAPASVADINTGTDNRLPLTSLGMQGSKYETQYRLRSFALSTTAANAYTATLSPAITTYGSGGMLLSIKFTNHNTGAATIDINGIGAVAIINSDGTALLAYDIIDGMTAVLQYNGTGFTLVNPASRRRLVGNTVAVSGGTLTLDADNKIEKKWIGAAAMTTNFILAIANSAQLEYGHLTLTINSTMTITCPSNFVMVTSDFRWNNTTKVLLVTVPAARNIELAWSKHGSIFQLKVSDYFYTS